MLLAVAGLSLLILTFFCARGWWRRYCRQLPDWMTWDDWLVASLHLKLATIILTGLWLAFVVTVAKSVAPP